MIALSTDQIRSALGKNDRWYDEFLRMTPTRDLLDRLEAWQYTRLENIGHESGRTFCELQIDSIRGELTRRRKLQAAASRNDAYAPSWPSAAERDARSQQRVEAVKLAWPIDLFVSQVMFTELIPTGRGKYKACCPFPDHDDSTPSFHVDLAKGLGYCFGCQRGGDVLTLAEIWFKLDRFADVLKTLEALSPIGRVA